MSKSKRGKSASTNEISKWEAEFAQTLFNEESWRSCVFFIAPNKQEDNAYLDVVSDVVSTGLRKMFSVITEEGLMKDVKDFGKAQTGGKGKGAPASKAPAFSEVCEQAKAVLDQGETILPSMMAKLVKFKLLQIKQKDLDRREEERKAAKAAEAGKKDEKGKKSRSPSGKSRSKSPGKKKGKKEADVPPSPKKDTKMKKRGDVEDTFKTIDDEPDDEGSPQHYVLIHGIWMAPVINHMAELGINIDAVICMRSETYDKFEVKKGEVETTEEQQAAEEQDPEVLDKAMKEEEERANQLEKEKQLQTFWTESDNIVLKAQSGNKLKDIAKYEVIVKDKDVPEASLKELEDEKKVEFGTVLFEDVAVTCYNMLDHFVLYKQYLESMKLVHVPVHTLTGTEPAIAAPSVVDLFSSQSATGVPAPDMQAPIPVEVDTRYYKHLMDTVPTESHSVPLILHCLLEQVTATVDENNPLDKEVPPRDDGLNHLLAAHIDSKAGKLALTEGEKKALFSDNAEEKTKTANSNVLYMLYHGDALTSQAHHLQPQNGLDPLQVQLQMLQFFPSSALKDLPEPKGRESAERAARANELRHFLKSKSVDPAILDHVLKQYAFEGMLLKTVTDDGYIIDPVDLDEAFRSYSNPWDHPYSKLEDFMKVKFCSDESGKLKIAEVDSNSPLTSFRNLDDWCFVEHFDQTTLLQLLEEARYSLPYVDTYYHKRDHSLLLVLHNPVGLEAKSQTSWQTKLHSNVGFRNYLDYVTTFIQSWVDEQERLRMEAARTPTPPPVVVEEPPPPLKEGSRYGLMTRSEVNALKAEEEEKNKKGKGKKSGRASRSPGRRSAKSRGGKDESPEKKDKKREGSSTSRPKSGRTSSAKGSLSVKSSSSKHDKKGARSKSRTSCLDDTEEDTSSQPIEAPVEEHFDFIGYDVGDKLIQASGSLTTLFPADGGQIRVDKNSYVQGTKNVRVSVLKDGNLFMLHFVDPVDEIMPLEDTEPEENKNKEDNSQERKEKQDEGIEKSEIEGNEKEQKEPIKKTPKGPKPFCGFSSFVAQFNDGMILSHSGYGPSGSIIGMETKETEAQLISSMVVPEGGGATHGTPSPQPKAGSPKSRKKMDEEVKRMEELQQQQEEERARAEEEARKREEEEKSRKPFQNLFITCPDGLHLEYFNNGAYRSALDKGGVSVRQRYPVKGLGKQECENSRQKPAMEEVSRTILTDGTVIKFMKDDFIQVLFPDGGISSCQSYPTSSKPTSQPASAVVAKQPEASPAKKGLRATSSQKSSEEPQVPTVNVPEKVAQWVSTGIGGARVRTKEDGEVESLDGVLYSLATCPETGQVLRTREDNVVTVERSDGTLVVEHADGTRITSFYQELQTQTQVPDNETGEEAQYKTINGKFVRVECPGFASLTFNCHEGSCGTVFGNGVFMETLADGVTTVERVDDSQLHIDAKGEVSFAPRELTDKIDLSLPAPTHQPTDIPAGVYVMRSTQQNCCEMKDLRGTHFCVISNGEMSIDKQESQKEKEKKGDSTEKRKEESSSIAQSFPQTSLVPRYFMIHSDGSGSELLRHVDVSGFLSRAEKDPATAVLSSPVEGHPEATGVTILKPYAGGISKEWLLTKIEDVIIPAAIRERDFTAFPSRHEKHPGPVFGTNVGAGLNVGTVIKNKPSSPPITCPTAFEFRQLIQYKRLTDEQRQQIVTCLKEYSEYVAKRQEKLDSMLPQDPRDESEKLIAESLELKMMEAEKEVKEETDAKDEDINHEEEEPEPEEEQAEIKDGIKEVIDSMTGQVQRDSVGQKYVDAITPAPVPRPPPPRWKRSRSEWERDKIELAELEYGKKALKNHEVPPYFETAQGQAFLQRAYNIPDMDTLTSRLAEQTRHPPPGDGSASETPRSESGGEELKPKFQQEFSSPEVAQVTSTSANTEDDSSPSANGNALSPNSLRPTNPTPAHATGDGTPTPLRPNNPTPAHASKPSNPRPSNPTPKHAEGLREELEPNNETSPVFEEQQQWRSNLESVREIDSTQDEQVDGIVTQSNNSSNNSGVITDTPGNPKVGAKSLYTDVTGGMRKDKVKLPTSILSSKPGALLNSQFLDIEDPVRRRVHTVSVAGGNKISPGRVEGLRGFELFPPKVSFGVLKEGCTYIHTVIMKNVGIDSCRFKIKQPPLSTGLRVVYNPGPVAAGMNAKLDIEIFAVAVGVVGESGVGQVGHHVEIVTETDVIYLPVYATIMTAYEYENRYGDQDSGHTSGTSRVPNRPPSRDPTRPRKSVEYVLINQESI